MTELARPLETGWRPDTPVEDSLLRPFTANQADLQDHLVAAVGGRCDRTPDVALSDSGVASAYLNQAVMLRPIWDAHDAVLDHVASFYAGSAGLLISPWPTPDLAGRGWQLVGHPMFVVRGPVGEPADAPPGADRLPGVQHVPLLDDGLRADRVPVRALVEQHHGHAPAGQHQRHARPPGARADDGGAPERRQPAQPLPLEHHARPDPVGDGLRQLGRGVLNLREGQRAPGADRLLWDRNIKLQLWTFPRLG